MVVAVVSPGQGAQKAGFLRPWLELPHARAQLRWWSQLVGLDLEYLGTAAEADEIKDTAKTQPLLAAAALLAGSELPLDDVAIVAGHSIGELPAAALAGALSSEAAVALAGVRGREMAAACALQPTGMTAILGGDEDEILDKLDRYGLTPANRNGAGQIVAAGPLDGLEKLAADPPAKARLISLQVAGAFHTEAMEPAKRALGELASGVSVHHPHKILLSNADGVAVTRGPVVLSRIVAQVTRPVRWDLIQHTLTDLGITALIELPPAGTLAGLAKRALKGVEIVTVNTPDDLAKARDLISRHGGAPTGEPHIEFTMAVAVAAGSFEPDPELTEGDTVTAGQQIGQIATRQGSVPVEVAHTGELTEWLAQPADPIAVGQPLARIHPTGDAR